MFSDDAEPEDRASNIKWFDFTLNDFNELAVKKLGIEFSIKTPYKLCDFKPMYGFIFEDYLKGYEYWAYGDLDVIYGKIFDYLRKIDYKKYCKINHAGHFCIMKNIPVVNLLFKECVEGSRNFEDVLESGNVAFDEIDMNAKARALGVPFYDGIFAADIMNEAGMQCVDGETIKRVFKVKSSLPSPVNYHYQIFLLENGRVVRYYRKHFWVKKDEFCYIHYRLELPIHFKDKKLDTYLFSFNPKGFFDIDVSKLKSLKSFMKIVRTYNKRQPVIIEKFLAVVNLIRMVRDK